jgi:MSHA biogenesis protein MshN
MSLVNDMLRDLDARRRDAPGSSLGPEKLIPASEQHKQSKPDRSGSKLKIVMLTAVLTVAAGIVYVYLQQPAQAPAGALPNLAVTAPTPTPVPAVDVVSEPDVDLQALRALEERLQQLEQQNQQLQVASSNRWQQRDWEEPSVDPTPEPAPITQIQPDRIIEESLANITPSPAAPEPAESAGSLVRDSRPLSLAERDRQQVQKALNEWADGQRLTALQTLDQFVYDNPTAHQSREMLAKLLIQQGESLRAMQAAEIGLTISPNHAGYRKIMARLLIDEGRAAEAIVLLDNFPPSAAADPEYHDVMATALLASQEFERAAQSYRSLLQQDQTVGRWWYGMAVALESRGRTADAAAAYERALQQASLSSGLRQNSQQRLAALRPD